MRLLEITYPVEAKERIFRLLDSEPALDWTQSEDPDGRCELRILARPSGMQEIVDRLQGALSSEEGWRIVVLPVEAVITPAEPIEKAAPLEPEPKRDANALREEIYQDVSDGARLDANFLALTALSAVVAALGLNADNVAVVVGAMVIAPLLGPILAFAFAAALGDLALMRTATRTALTGLAVGAATAFAIGLVIDVDLASQELSARTDIGLDSVTLALASGAAAALSIVTGLSSALVGVMVAVALLPPSAAAAIYLAAGAPAEAGAAAFLLAINVVSVIIASQIVFVVKGVRPRTWLERRSAKRSRRVNLAVWGVLLAAMTALIALRFAGSAG
ncbi:MAG: TIGR00341 family protein [Parvularculaceae bacterium]